MGSPGFHLEDRLPDNGFGGKYIKLGYHFYCLVLKHHGKDKAMIGLGNVESDRSEISESGVMTSIDEVYLV